MKQLDAQEDSSNTGGTREYTGEEQNMQRKDEFGRHYLSKGNVLETINIIITNTKFRMHAQKLIQPPTMVSSSDDMAAFITGLLN